MWVCGCVGNTGREKRNKEEDRGEEEETANKVEKTVKVERGGPRKVWGKRGVSLW